MAERGFLAMAFDPSSTARGTTAAISASTRFEKMTGKGCDGKGVTVGNREVLMIPGASHVNLYDDQAGVIPYDKLEQFFRDNLK